MGDVGRLDDSSSDVQQKVDRIVVQVIDPHPSERARVLFIPLNSDGGFPIAGWRSHHHKIAASGSDHLFQSCRTAHDTVGYPWPAYRCGRDPDPPLTCLHQ